MANEGNLKPQAHVLTVEEQSKGGVASGESRREKRRIREALEIVMGTQFPAPELSEIPLDGLEMDGAARLAVAVFEKALGGDMRAVEFIRDTIGEKPTEQVDVTTTEAKFTELLEQFELRP